MAHRLLFASGVQIISPKEGAQLASGLTNVEFNVQDFELGEGKDGESGGRGSIRVSQVCFF